MVYTLLIGLLVETSVSIIHQSSLKFNDPKRRQPVTLVDFLRLMPQKIPGYRAARFA
jgi:hypothetical protein